jgi:hypothetical protein
MSTKLFGVASVTFDQPEDPLTIHLHNLRILFAEHKANEIRYGPMSAASLYRKCTQKYLTFYSCNTMSHEFMRMYKELATNDGKICGKLTSADTSVYDGPSNASHVNRGSTPHGIPYVFEFMYSNPCECPLNQTDSRVDTTFGMCQFSTNEMNAWSEKNDSNNIVYTNGYKELVLKHTGIQVSDKIVVDSNGVSMFGTDYKNACDRLNKHYRDYMRTCMSKYLRAINQSSTGNIHVSSTMAGPHITMMLRFRCITGITIYHHFTNVVAKSMLANVPRVIQPTIDELINTPLPNESAVDTEIRASLRMDAYINANSRFLLALLHVSHADIEVVKRGKLLMHSAADDGSDRATQWLAAQPQEVEWSQVSDNEVDADDEPIGPPPKPPTKVTKAIKVKKENATAKPPPYK